MVQKARLLKLPYLRYRVLTPSKPLIIIEMFFQLCNQMVFLITKTHACRKNSSSKIWCHVFKLSELFSEKDSAPKSRNLDTSVNVWASRLKHWEKCPVAPGPTRGFGNHMIWTFWAISDSWRVKNLRILLCYKYNLIKHWLINSPMKFEYVVPSTKHVMHGQAPQSS